jgi:hypothetical protein
VGVLGVLVDEVVVGLDDLVGIEVECSTGFGVGTSWFTFRSLHEEREINSEILGIR